MIGTANHLHTVSSAVTSVSVTGPTGGRSDESTWGRSGPASDVRKASYGGSSIMQLPRTSHPSYTPSTDDRTRNDTGVQPDTDPPGLL